MEDPAAADPTQTGRLDPETWIRRIREGDRRLLARAVSAVEMDAPEASLLLAGLAAFTGKARKIGITGAPGVGKSTLVSGLISTVREQGRTAAVIAVDPSSPLTAGRSSEIGSGCRSTRTIRGSI